MCSSQVVSTLALVVFLAPVAAPATPVGGREGGVVAEANFTAGGSMTEVELSLRRVEQDALSAAPLTCSQGR